MASAQVVETSVNTNNSPSQDYTTNPDDHSNHNTNYYVWKMSKDTVTVWNYLYDFVDINIIMVFN